MSKYKFIFCIIFVVCSIFSFNILYFCANAMALDYSSALGMVVMEIEHNKVLYSKDMDKKLPMASTTKIITAITCIENCDDLDAIVTVPKSATLVEGSSIYLKPNERLSIRQLLYGLMLQSGNDCAETLAMAIGGDKENFAKMMNDTARKCGANNTSLITPHGLDDKEHYTTAYDLAIITSYALKNPIFREIVSSKSYKINATEYNTARTLINKNKLLSSVEGCCGVKTGYTRKSGRCLVSACERDGMTIVCVVLNCAPMFEESASLIEKAFREYKRIDILPSYKFAVDVTVEDGENNSVRLYNKNGYYIVDKEENADKYTIEYEYEKSIKAPVEKDQVLGVVKIYYDKSLIFSENLCSIESVAVEKTPIDIENILENW